MGDKDVDAIGQEEATKWDPTFTEQIKNWVGPVIKRYFRAEVHGLDAIPAAGGALLVSNHSGGMFTPDVLVFAPAFYDKFGFDRPVYTLAHYGVFIGPLAEWLHRAGVIEASRENAAKALHAGALVLVFPGGDYDSYRPTLARTRSTSPAGPDTSGPLSKAVCRSCRWCRSARRKSQLFLTRGNWLAKRLGLERLRDRDPAGQFRVPVRASACSSRRTCRCRPRSSRRCWTRSTWSKEFGEDPDVDAVDAHVREVMQAALDKLAQEAPVPDTRLT